MTTATDSFPIPCPDAEARSPAKLAHLVLTSRSYEAAIQWWCLVLGARVMFRNEALLNFKWVERHAG
jgi:hypothetical protein